MFILWTFHLVGGTASFAESEVLRRHPKNRRAQSRPPAPLPVSGRNRI
jgi:hypothetical protein